LDNCKTIPGSPEEGIVKVAAVPTGTELDGPSNVPLAPPLPVAALLPGKVDEVEVFWPEIAEASMCPTDVVKKPVTAAVPATTATVVEPITTDRRSYVLIATGVT
jgi:hypothetical protein